jgi:hypothetical protein
MISQKQAESLTHGTRLTHTSTGRFWRVSGKCKTWVRSPEHFRIPIKAGLYRNWEINESNCMEFNLVGETV